MESDVGIVRVGSGERRVVWKRDPCSLARAPRRHTGIRSTRENLAFSLALLLARRVRVLLANSSGSHIYIIRPFARALQVSSPSAESTSRHGRSALRFAWVTRSARRSRDSTVSRLRLSQLQLPALHALTSHTTVTGDGHTSRCVLSPLRSFHLPSCKQSTTSSRVTVTRWQRAVSPPQSSSCASSCWTSCRVPPRWTSRPTLQAIS